MRAHRDHPQWVGHYRPRVGGRFVKLVAPDPDYQADRRPPYSDGVPDIVTQNVQAFNRLVRRVMADRGCPEYVAKEIVHRLLEWPGAR